MCASTRPSVCIHTPICVHAHAHLCACAHCCAHTVVLRLLCTHLVQTTSAQGEQRGRRAVNIVDATGYMLQCTLWGDHADVEESLLDAHPVIAIANVQIRDWRGRAGSTLSTSEVVWNPKADKDAQALKEWYHTVSVCIQRMCGCVHAKNVRVCMFVCIYTHMGMMLTEWRHNKFRGHERLGW